MLFLGGRAGLGDSGRGGGAVGAWRIANGSQPKGSFSALYYKDLQYHKIYNTIKYIIEINFHTVKPKLQTWYGMVFNNNKILTSSAGVFGLLRLPSPNGSNGSDLPATTGSIVKTYSVQLIKSIQFSMDIKICNSFTRYTRY